MDPLLVRMSSRFHRLTSRDAIESAGAKLEDAYDYSGIEQETVARISEALGQRLERAP